MKPVYNRRHWVKSVFLFRSTRHADWRLARSPYPSRLFAFILFSRFSIGHMRPERPPHLHPDQVHPAFREKGRVLPPARTIDKQAKVHSNTIISNKIRFFKENYTKNDPVYMSRSRKYSLVMIQATFPTNFAYVSFIIFTFKKRYQS